MKAWILNRVFGFIIINLVMISFYHLSVLTGFNKEIAKSIYHIATNATILALSYYIYQITKEIRDSSVYLKIIKALSVYPIYKIILNFLFMSGKIAVFLNKFNTHIWSITLIGLILIILIRIKFIKK